MKRIITLISILILSIVLLNSCGKKSFDDTYQKLGEKSLNACKKLTIDYTVVDQSVKVYEYIREIDFRENIEISEKTYTLSTSTFDLSSEETFVVEEESNRLVYLNMILKEELISNYELKDNILTINTTKDNLGKIIGIDNLSINNDQVDIIISLDDVKNDMKIMSMTVEFINNSNQSSVITYTFGY